MKHPCEICVIGESIDVLSWVSYDGYESGSHYLCESCVDMFYDDKIRKMMGITRIVTVEDYEFNKKRFCENCALDGYEFVYGSYVAYYENGSRYLFLGKCSKSPMVTHGVKEIYIKN